MPSVLRIKITGIGGQGVQFFSKLLIDAAFNQGLNVTGTSFYEPASTGGLTVSDVIITHHENEIIFPFIEEPQVLICLAQRAWDVYKDQVTKKTVVLVDKSNVQNFSGPEVDLAKLHMQLPFYEMAIGMGSEKLGNVIALGFLAEMIDFDDHYIPAALQDKRPEEAEEHELLEVDARYFEESLIKSSPEKFREGNVNAFKTGYQLSLDQDYPREMRLQHPKDK